MESNLSSNLDRHQLISALSEWLQQPNEAESSSSAAAASYPIPMVYSHEYWFETCLGPACAEIGEALNQVELDEVRLFQLLLHAGELIRRVEEGYCSRERMTDFLEPLKQLLRCSEKPTEMQVRKLGQRAFTSLLDRFEPTGQFLLLAHLFQLVFDHELVLSEEVYEPQVLAYLVDIFRQKCFASPNSKCSPVFQSHLGRFYVQLAAVVYEDPLLAVNFHAAVLLLVKAQAIHRVQLPLLKSMGQPLIDKFRRQLRDWTDLQGRRGKNGEKQGAFPGEMEPGTLLAELERRQEEEKLEMDQGRLAMFAFQLDEAERRVDEALRQGGG